MTNTGDGFVEKMINNAKLVMAYTREEKLARQVKLCIAETARELDKRCLVMDAKRHDFVHAVCQDLLNQCGENK